MGLLVRNQSSEQPYTVCVVAPLHRSGTGAQSRPNVCVDHPAHDKLVSDSEVSIPRDPSLMPKNHVARAMGSLGACGSVGGVRHLAQRLTYVAPFAFDNYEGPLGAVLPLLLFLSPIS